MDAIRSALQGVIAEQLCAVVDESVAVDVDRQKCDIDVSVGPCDLFGLSIPVDVE